jgi:hypothetical protein
VNRFLPHLTFSNVVACLALFVALGGAAYAATQLPKNSVGPQQIRKNAVTASKVKDGSLLPSDFAQGKLPRGERGPQGEPGPSTGPAGGALSGTYPNPGLASEVRGVAAAGVAGSSNGTLELYFNRFGGAPTITHPATGEYDVKFPGLDVNVTSDTIAFGNGGGTNQVAVGSTQGEFIVTVSNAAGTPVNGYWSMVAFRGHADG